MNYVIKVWIRIYAIISFKIIRHQWSPLRCVTFFLNNMSAFLFSRFRFKLLCLSSVDTERFFLNKCTSVPRLLLPVIQRWASCFEHTTSVWSLGHTHTLLVLVSTVSRFSKLAVFGSVKSSSSDNLSKKEKK